jgi:hypothetical protein
MFFSDLVFDVLGNACTLSRKFKCTTVMHVYHAAFKTGGGGILLELLVQIYKS